MSNVYVCPDEMFGKLCEALRLEMQVKRFELFREAGLGLPAQQKSPPPQRTLVVAQDVRDLVELTVDRMDVYHLVPWKALKVLGFDSGH